MLTGVVMPNVGASPNAIPSATVSASRPGERPVRSKATNGSMNRRRNQEYGGCSLSGGECLKSKFQGNLGVEFFRKDSK